MKTFKKGEIVARISYGKDIFFIIERIIKLNNTNQIAILKGLTIRIKADSPITDLEKIDKSFLRDILNTAEQRFIDRLKRNNKRILKNTHKYGKVLHLDGDSRYSLKSIKYYKNIGINAIVKNISENKQPLVVQNLLQRFKPDILVITGHDAMIKNTSNFNDLYNYRNSAYFIKTVKAARSWENYSNNLAIFAGACQSYYEAIIAAGANFASSPARILIDFVDPLIVAENIAVTDYNKFISIRDFENELRDGQKGISGVGVYGKKF